MKLKPISYVAVMFGVLAIADLYWLQSLPASLPTTSVEHRRGYFLLCIFYGVMSLLQGTALLSSPKSRSLRLAGTFAIAMGVFGILAGIRIALVHMSGS